MIASSTNIPPFPEQAIGAISAPGVQMGQVFEAVPPTAMFGDSHDDGDE